jgi:uncharacterized membrane protein YeaQ/YmgE (transglycosylase-associated protein family)
MLRLRQDPGDQQSMASMHPLEKRALSTLEDLMRILWWILIGLVAGWATGKIMRGGGYGFWLDILLGVAGALVGGFIARAVGLAATGGILYTLLIAIVGSILVVLIFRLLAGRGRPINN